MHCIGRSRTGTVVGLVVLAIAAVARAGADEGPWIRVNQVGYLPGDPKVALLSSDRPLQGDFAVGDWTASIGLALRIAAPPQLSTIPDLSTVHSSRDELDIVACARLFHELASVQLIGRVLIVSAANQSELVDLMGVRPGESLDMVERERVG